MTHLTLVARPAKEACPFAAANGAISDARHADICNADVATLIKTGEDIAISAMDLAPKLMTLTDGRVIGGNSVNFTAHGLMLDLLDAVAGQLDVEAADVIRTSAKLYLRQAVLVRREQAS